MPQSLFTKCLKPLVCVQYASNFPVGVACCCTSKDISTKCSFKSLPSVFYNYVGVIIFIDCLPKWLPIECSLDATDPSAMLGNPVQCVAREQGQRTDRLASKFLLDVIAALEYFVVVCYQESTSE